MTKRPESRLYGKWAPVKDTYRSWAYMKQRCLNQNHVNYHLYGGRGITICERWMRFDNFFADMGEKPPGWTIERIDGNGNYEPGNCRWATTKEQSRNRSNTRKITHDGVTLCMTDWASKLGITHQSMQARLRRWPLEKALTLSARPGVSGYDR